MNLKKFIVPGLAFLAGGTLGIVFGVKNADGIKEAYKTGKEAAEEKMKQLKEAAEERTEKGVVLNPEEVTEVVDNITNGVKDAVEGVKDDVKAAVQPRGKDGKFVKKS